MKYLLLLLLLSSPVLAAPLVIDTCAVYTLNGNTVTCASTPPATCPPGQTGTPPNCVTPQPPSSLSNCTNAGYTVIGGAPIVVTWGDALSALSGTFGNSQVWVFSMVVPANTPQTSGIGYFNVVENGGSPTLRQMFMETTPCSFVDSDGTASQGVTATVFYNTLPPQTPNGGYKNLVPGTTYYITIRNFNSQTNAGTCPNNNCPAIMNAQPQ